MTGRVRIGIVALVAVAAIVGTLVLTGALGPREDERVPIVALGDTIETSRADIAIEAFANGEDGAIVVTATITSHLPVSILNDDLFHLVDDAGDLALWGYGTVDGVSANSAQPGVTDTFDIEFVVDREIEGSVRAEVRDATWTPRDETAFGLGSNSYDEHAVAYVRMP
ncbi:hypothetical protein [Agrococcus jejuensis]|uniref:DUF4352 domain-containing protein n=1 Tax=Agrococcus jejuensis TaxID=399736 RepID=A0A1G8AQ23_9MICO|nr:hypothetical protein [Agrococcus jejuensis]SDH23078.1 hypothetical protein SAMN04489720_0484 [Agrococcus jejuensis]